MISKSFGTHDGKFHADEVSACVFLSMFSLIDLSKVVRTRDPERLQTCEYVCDVGGVYNPSQKKFDHHQPDYQGNLASAGMVWNYLLDIGLVSSELHEFIYQKAVYGIDGFDNGKIGHTENLLTFSHIIEGFSPLHSSITAKEWDIAFFQAVEFAQGVFQRLFAKFDYLQGAKSAIQLSMQTNQPFLVLEKPLPWADNFFALGGEKHPACFLIAPIEGGWKVRAIPKSADDPLTLRCPFPASWAGLRGSELSSVSGIPGAVFCHKSLFMAIWESREAAILAAQKALKHCQEGVYL